MSLVGVIVNVTNDKGCNIKIYTDTLFAASAGTIWGTGDD